MTRVKLGVLASAIAIVCSVGFGTASASAAPGGIPGLPGLPPLPEPIAKLFAPPVPPSKKLATDFAVLQKSMRRSLPGNVGVAIVPVNSDRAIALGTVRTGRAWSTLKVPVSLAAQRKYGVAVAEREDKALTLSDNDAAGALWGSLGGGRVSVDAVTKVLREGHDIRTHVSSEADRPASYPGYTQWALADQARFGAHLPCMAGSETVIRLMSAVAPNQNWGATKLGRNDAVTAVKGGWGPATDTSPGYLVRQLAVITTNRGQVAVTMAALPRSGRFEDGTTMLNRVGAWLGRELPQLPTGRC